MIDALVGWVGVPREGGNPTLIFLVQMGAIFAIFYLLLIRPHRKEQQKHRDMVADLKKGQEVITAGGIMGKVIHAQEDRITITTGENTRIVVERSKVAHVVKPASAE